MLNIKTCHHKQINGKLLHITHFKNQNVLLPLVIWGGGVMVG